MQVAEGEGVKEPGGKVGRAVGDTRVAKALADTEAVGVEMDTVAQGEAVTEAVVEGKEAVAKGEGVPLALSRDAEGEPVADCAALPLGEEEGAALALAMERVPHRVAEGELVAEGVARLSLGAAVALGAAEVVLEARGEGEAAGESEAEGDAAGDALPDGEREGEREAEGEGVEMSEAEVEWVAEAEAESEGGAEGAPDTEEEGVAVPSKGAEGVGAALPLRTLPVPLTVSVRFAVREEVGAAETVAMEREGVRVGFDMEANTVAVAGSVMETLLRVERVAVGRREAREEADFEAAFDATAGALRVAAALGEGVAAALRVGVTSEEGVAVELSDAAPDAVGEREAGPFEPDAAAEGDVEGEGREALGCDDLVPPRVGVWVPLPPEEERVAPPPAGVRVPASGGEGVATMLLVSVLARLAEGRPLTDCEGAGLLEGCAEDDGERLSLGELL